MAPDYHSLVVDRVIPETLFASTLVFQVPSDLQPLFCFQPGQFLTLRVPRGDRYSPRCYSISSGPGEPLAVTVKRVRGGFGSNWLLDHVKAGHRLEVRPPSGRFTPRTMHRSLVLFAAGSGITPMMSILRHQMAEGLFDCMAMFYANQDPDQVIFGSSLREMARVSGGRFVLTEWIDQERGFATLADIVAYATPWKGAHFMLCGPEAFMRLVSEALEGLGIPSEQVQTEKFVSLSDEPIHSSRPEAPGSIVQSDLEESSLELQVSGESHLIPVQRDETLLAAIERMGVAVPFSCREGSCGSCMGRLLDGEVHMDVTDALSQKERERGYVLTCQAYPRSARLKVDIDA